MYIVVADHKVVLVTDVDDVAWETAEEMMFEDDYVDAQCEHAYAEEVDERDFDSDGKYMTSEGDVITLTEYRDAKHFISE